MHPMHPRFSSSLQWAAGPHRTLAGQPGEARKTLRRPLRPFQHIYSYIYIIYIIYIICTKKNHVHLLVQTKFMQKCPKLNIAMIINDYQWPSMVFNYQQDRVIQVHTSSYKFIQLPLDFHTFPCLSHVCRLLSRGSSHKVHEARGEVIDGTWRANGSNGHLWGPNHDLTCYSRGDMGWLSYMGL